MGGTKRKIPMEKIKKKDARAVAFSKRRLGLYSKATELCHLSGSKIAILATPISSQSNASFYSFGISSVDSVVSAFLSNQREDLDLGLGLGYWWEDERLVNSENPDELREALDSISRLTNNLKELRLEAVKNREELKKKKKDVVLRGTHQKLDRNQTLNFESTSASLCIHDDLPVNFEGFVKNTEEQILEISDNNNNALHGDLGGFKQELDLYQIFDFETKSESLSMNDVSMVTTNQNPCSGYDSAEDGALMNMDRDLDEDNIHFYNLDEDQILAISDNNNCSFTNLDRCNRDQIFDFETKSESLSMDDVSMVTTNQNPFSGYKSAEDGALVNMQRDLDEDDLHLYDVDEDQILMISDNNTGSSTNLDRCNLDQIIDFETKYEGFKMDDASMMVTSQNPCSDSEAVEDRELVIQRDLDEDNIRFSDFFNELVSIVTL